MIWGGISGPKEEANKEKEMCSIESLNSQGSLDSNREDDRASLILSLTLYNVRMTELSKAAEVFEMFGTQIYCFETRQAKKPKNSVHDLDIFVECEVHSADVGTLITSLKRVAKDVKTTTKTKCPGFPKKIQDLDKCHHLITKYDPSLYHDHPGYSDPEYNKWRAFFPDLAFNYRVGDPLPHIEYTAQETATWDCCHELLGHVPMLTDKEFSQFSQDIGLASLGSSEEEVEKLATVYWLSVEFGLCKQNGLIKVYGAGLLSPYGELMYALSNKPEYKPFDPEVTAVHPYQDQAFQPVYFKAENLEDAKVKLQNYAMKIKKPFALHYDPFTSSIELLSTPQKVKRALHQIKEELKNLYLALENLY